MQSVHQFAKRHALPLSVAGLIIVALIVVPESVFAAASAADAIAGVLAQLILWIASLVGSIALYLLEIFFTKVISYNDFINHGVVVKGWQMVRNVVNVGFVGALLVIGFGTMFGISRINWRQQVPSLLIGAVVVNFSRLICGLLIDVGQVFMMAFANAIQQAGAGNFVALFSIDKIQSLSPAKIGGAELLFAAIFALVLSVIILIVIFVFMAILTYRIVVLWVLIILSPIAFFIGSIKGVFNSVGGEYQQWWQKFTASITIGPILLFFLWLALTAVTGEGLTIPGGSVDVVPDSSGLAATGFNVEVLTSFIIAIALLLAGLEVAQQTAGQIGGFAGKAAAMGKGYATKVASAPVAYGAVAGGWALRKTGQKAKGAAKAVGGGVRDYYRGATADKRQKKMAAERRRAERLATDTGRFGLINRARGRSRLGKIGAREELEKKRQTELINKHKGDFDTFSPDEKKAFIERVNSNEGASETDKAKVAAIEQSTVLDSKKFEEMMGSDPETAKKWYKSVKDRAKDSGDEVTTKTLATMAESRPSLMGKGRSGTAGALKNMSHNQLLRIDSSEFEDPEMLAAAMDAGLFDEIQSDERGFSQSMKNLATRYGGKGAAETGRRDTFMEAADEHDRERSSIASNPALNDEQREDAYRQNDANLNYQTAVAGGKVAGALKAGKFKLEDLSVPAAGSAEHASFVEELSNALQEAGSAKALTSLNQARSTENDNADQRARANAMHTFISGAPLSEADFNARGSGDAKKVGAARLNQAVLGQGASRIGYDNATQEFRNKDQERAFKANVVSNPNLILNFTSQMDVNNMSNGLGRSVAESFNKDALRDMLEALDAARGGKNEGEQREVLERIGAALEAQTGKLAGDIGKQVDEAAEFYRKRVASQIERRSYS